MQTCKERSRLWVHGFAAVGAGVAAVPNPWLPGATAGALVTGETYMAYMVSKIYREPLGPLDAVGLLASLGTLSEGLKVVALQACDYIPIAGWLVKGTIAASAIEAMGHLVIAHFEDKFPGRLYESDPEVEKSPKT